MVKPRLKWAKRLHKDENGAALLIALLAVVLMTLIGLALFEVVGSGIVHSSAVEADIEAEMLAQNGLDEALALIRDAVNNGNAHPSVDPSKTTYRNKIDAVENKLDAMLTTISDDPLHHKGEFTVQTDKGRYTVDFGLDLSKPDPALRRTRKIADPNELAYSPSPDMPYVRQITVTSVGETNNHPIRSVKKQMKVFVSTINPVFRYPVSATDNLSLKGAPYIVGDVLVKGNNGGKLSISKKAHFIKITGEEYDVVSDYPSIKGFINVMSDQYEVDGAVAPNFERWFFSQVQPFEDDTLAKDEPIDIPAMVAQKTTEALATSFDADTTYTIGIGGGKLGSGFGVDTISDGTSKSGIRFHDDQWLTIDGDLDIYGNVVMTKGALKEEAGSSIAIHDGSVSVSLNDPSLVAADLKGTIELDEGRFMAVTGNAVLNNFNFDGTMFVDGNLKIIGNLNVKGTLYVNGSVEMKEMQSINADATFVDAPVIIVAQNEIILSDNFTAAAAGVPMRAFLYSSDADLNIYGVLSRPKIEGGVHGKNVMLSGVRGNYTDSAGYGAATIDPDTNRNYIHTSISPPLADYYFDDHQELVSPEFARLKIFYDDALYADPPSGIPVTEDVSVFVKQIAYIE